MNSKRCQWSLAWIAVQSHSQEGREHAGPFQLITSYPTEMAFLFINRDWRFNTLPGTVWNEALAAVCTYWGLLMFRSRCLNRIEICWKRPNIVSPQARFYHTCGKQKKKQNTMSWWLRGAYEGWCTESPAPLYIDAISWWSRPLTNVLGGIKL